MNKEDQQYKIIKYSKKDLIDQLKKNGIKDINYIAVNNVLNKFNKKYGGDKVLEELQEDMKKQRDKAAKSYGIENDPNISDEEMLKKIFSKYNDFKENSLYGKMMEDK